MKKLRGILAQTLAYTVTIGVAVLVARHFSDWHLLWAVAAGDAAGTVTIFIFSVIFNNSSLYDPYWSVKPMVIAVGYLFLLPDPGDARGWITAALMLLYGIRLTSNFLRDWPGLEKEDWRYVNFRNQYPKLYWLISFSGVHVFPTVLVYLACIPAYYAMLESDGPLNGWDFLGAIIFLSSIIVSYVADGQMRSFRQDPANRGKIMTAGLWEFSRHPNYLGEVMGWWGLWLMAFAVDPALYWTAAGAAAITLLFYFISIPLMDRRSQKRRPQFRAYMDRTPSLFPFPWRRKA
ncbi:MAG: DUF1295 domain-containing protein [Bacteroidota bacterium]